jgi:mannose-1-phosphate guanylyltransferase/mannose-6-phosphate isomerase
MKYEIHPVILCGGSGTRLWPLSTPATPKQFLALTSDRSMIEETALRFASNTGHDLSFATPLVVGSKRHQSLLDQTLPGARKILEPFGRNSAPAVAAACLVSAPEDLILILSADHDIQDVPAFQDAIAIAAEAAADGSIVTFGIEPNHPATGYGYIKASAGDAAIKAVEQFVEKPDRATAQAYLEAGSYYWNAGIFLFKAGVMLEALKRFSPDILSGTQAAMAGCERRIMHLDPQAFEATPSLSIDYAVMEKAENVQTVPVNMGWSDIGGYHALHELLTEDARDNYMSGPVVLMESEGVYVRSEGPAVSVNGVSDLVIVATEHEIMITPTSDDSAVKRLGAEVQQNRHRLGISEAARQRAKDWLWKAFDVWAEKAWDSANGGFVEQLDLNGTPDTKADRRVRVQARQVYSFSQAIELGWSNKEAATKLIENGLEYIDTRLRHPDGGWVHTIAADGKPIDTKRDLYDHAFIILAGAAAYKATNNPRALKIADDALAYVEADLKDATHGGWFDTDSRSLPRRSNPHMHMLEAMLAYHDAAGDALALERARFSVNLFEKHFFDPSTNVMAEFFGEDWQPNTPPSQTIFEPGHHYEWATLLSMYDQVSGHDSLSWRRRLIRRADETGLNSATGFAINALRENGEITNSNSRLWHQLEMLRAYLLHPGVASRAKAEALLNKIFETYLDVGPEGGWMDEIDSSGAPASKTVPASMLYHVVTAFAPLI